MKIQRRAAPMPNVSDLSLIHIYIVYDDYCDYTVIQLQPIGVLEESGSDLNPFWPETRLEGDQQLGDRDEVYELSLIHI